MSIAIRPITPEEFEPFTNSMAVGFGSPVAKPKFTEGQQALCEYDRTLAAFDGGEIVGTAGIFSFDMTVPGGSLPTAGVTWITVKPTHRRRGVLSGMMRQQLSDVRDRGEPFAALWASESVIYGRFGYGLAAGGVDLKIDRTRTTLASRPPVCGQTRLIDRDEALKSYPAVYDRVRVEQPGMYTRSETWWQSHSLPERDSGGAFSQRFFVLHEVDGEAQGYARYRIRGDNQDGVPNGTLAVQELMAATDEAYAGLWSYLFGVDLIAEIRAHRRRSDEPLLWMLADPRRLVRHPHDSLWLRIVDVIPALEGRSYAAEGRVVFQVEDEFCGWTAGTYELEAGPDGARCQTAAAEPELALSIADLSAALLGGVRLSTLRHAGRVRGDDAAIRLADALFAWEPLPWCPEVF
ncbi:MAG: GNAT family N-acetyltransferase [Chloroflexi bacterium]|nr:GNAT family N-acetyltransferase [Chloroflexota bacterium]